MPAHLKMKKTQNKTKTGSCYGRTLYNFHGWWINKGHLLAGLNCKLDYGSKDIFSHLMDGVGVQD